MSRYKSIDAGDSLHTQNSSTHYNTIRTPHETSNRVSIDSIMNQNTVVWSSIQRKRQITEVLGHQTI